MPSWLTQTVQRCLVDIDLALGGGLSEPQTRMLLAQADALVSVVGASADTGAGR